MELTSYGFDVYTSEVDDHGIDFVAKTKGGRYLELQVKAVRQNNYTFMSKDKWNIDEQNTYLILLLFTDNKMPDVYMIPATSWKSPDALLVDKDYVGFKSKPEYGVNISKKNLPLLERFSIEKTIESVILINDSNINKIVGKIK
jgi:hypothetical protein